MFDRAIIDTENFMDLPTSSKALYFLLGMEADDEGFVSSRKVMKIHNFSEDDLKILIAKGYAIKFRTGVIVMTHWHQNNYLDKSRIKRTQYEDERGQLQLTRHGKYVLNNGLTDVKREESSREENRREEKAFSKEKEEEIQKAKEKAKQALIQKGILK